MEKIAIKHISNANVLYNIIYAILKGTLHLDCIQVVGKKIYFMSLNVLILTRVPQKRKPHGHPEKNKKKNKQFFLDTHVDLCEMDISRKCQYLSISDFYISFITHST